MPLVEMFVWGKWGEVGCLTHDSRVILISVVVVIIAHDGDEYLWFAIETGNDTRCSCSLQKCRPYTHVAHPIIQLMSVQVTNTEHHAMQS